MVVEDRERTKKPVWLFFGVWHIVYIAAVCKLVRRTRTRKKWNSNKKTE